MQTTIQLNDALLEEAEREARRRGVTLAELIEDGLRRELTNGNGDKRPRVELPAFGPTGPPPDGLDLNCNASIQEFLDRDLPLDKLR